MLTLAPIIGAFLIDYVRPRGTMAPHIECWLLLVDILGLLTCGGTQAVEYMECVDITPQNRPWFEYNERKNKIFFLPSLYQKQFVISTKLLQSRPNISNINVTTPVLQSIYSATRLCALPKISFCQLNGIRLYIIVIFLLGNDGFFL